MDHRSREGGPGLGPEARRAIGAAMREALRPVTSGPLPDAQVELLLSLRRKLRESAATAPRPDAIPAAN